MNMGAGNIPTEVISVQFYYTSFTIVVRKDNKVQLLQNLVYETPERCSLSLLNVVQQYNFDRNNITVMASGMIDLDYKLYRELKNYFSNIDIRKVTMPGININISEHPLHYFTLFQPYFMRIISGEFGGRKIKPLLICLIRGQQLILQKKACS
jgi:hypothetical protein